MAQDYIVKDIGLADWGRKELDMAETEMPGLMAIRKEYGPKKPLKGARVAGSLHMTIQTGVLIETLKALGADVRWASCNIYRPRTMLRPPSPRPARRSSPSRARASRNTGDYTHKIFEWGDGGEPNMILDDGGDATLLVHLGMRAEKDASLIAKPTNEEEEVLYKVIAKTNKAKPGWYAKLGAASRASPRRRPRACTGSTRWRRTASSCGRPSTSISLFFLLLKQHHPNKHNPPPPPPPPTGSLCC